MNLFKKNKKEAGVAPGETIQSLQQSFNQVMFELGDLNYRKHMINAELAKINSEINTRVQKADDMGKRAGVLRALAQEELKKKVAEAPLPSQSESNETNSETD